MPHHPSISSKLTWKALHLLSLQFPPAFCRKWTEPTIERISVTVHPLHCLQAAQSAAAPAASALAPPPPPPVTFASNSNGGGSSSGAFSSTIGDVFTYRPSTGGSIESAGAVGPTTTALTTNNGARPAFYCICVLHSLFEVKTLNLEP